MNDSGEDVRAEASEWGVQYGSLCTGIGGLDLAVEAHFGATAAWHSELEPAPCEVLERHWPGVPNLGDLTVIDWASVPPVDILTAGYPCQPFSHAGKRKGSKDARHLWPHIIEAVRVLRPRHVVLENVRGHLSLGFDAVLGSLAEAGFDAEWCLLRASDVGACHQRARLFIVARNADVAPSDALASAGRSRGRSGEPGSGAAADARRERHGGGQDVGLVGRLDRGAEGEARERQRPREVALDRGAAAHADGPGLEAPRRHEADGLGPPAWGVYGAAIARWELVLGRCAPRPVDDQGRLDPPFVEWMMGYPAGWIGDLGRTKALKALGNAVVPQQALAALRELAPEASYIGAVA